MTQHRIQTPRDQSGITSDESSRAVSEFLTGRTTIAEIAYGLNLPEATVRDWIRRASFEADPAQALARAEAEIETLRAEAAEALARAEAEIEAARAEAADAKDRAETAKKATVREKNRAAEAVNRAE